MDYIEIGPSPAEEPCEQANVSGSNYERMKAECRAFVQQLRRQLGPEPEGARLSVRFNRDGDYGYYEVACSFEPNNRAAIDYAFKCESEAPAKWDEMAKQYLAGIPVGRQA